MTPREKLSRLVPEATKHTDKTTTVSLSDLVEEPEANPESLSPDPVVIKGCRTHEDHFFSFQDSQCFFCGYTAEKAYARQELVWEEVAPPVFVPQWKGYADGDLVAELVRQSAPLEQTEKQLKNELVLELRRRRNGFVASKMLQKLGVKLKGVPK